MLALLAVAVFVAAVALDYIEAHYVRAVGRLDGHRAALYSVGMYVVGCVGFLSVLDVSYWLLIPEGCGLYVGSRLAVKRLAQKSLAPV